MTDTALETRGLTKSFGATRALDGLDLTVETGRVTGFLGPNGAGKSTTIRVLLGLLRADGGHVRVLGHDPWADPEQVHRRVAYVPGETSLWPDLTGGEVVDLLTRGRGKRKRDRREELIARFELDPTRKCRNYSKGNRQKVVLIAALAGDAELLLLDEPTSGLDPLMVAVFTEEVRRLRAEGRTVLLSSHILDEVEKLSDSVTIVRGGRAVEAGSLAELRHLTRSGVTAVTRGDATRLRVLPGVHDLVLTDDRVSFDVDPSDLTSVLRVLADLGVHDLTVTPPSLEELFLRHYGDRLPQDEEVTAP